MQRVKRRWISTGSANIGDELRKKKSRQTQRIVKSLVWLESQRRERNKQDLGRS